MQKELLSTAELAARLGVKPLTVRLWVLQGRIPEIRLSHKVRRFRWDDVLKALQERTQGQAQARRKQDGGEVGK